MKWAKGLGMVAATSLFVLSGCGTSDIEPEDTTSGEDPVSEEPSGETVTVNMTMDNGGEVVMELYPDIAPKTVDNFVSLAEDGFYDGLTFHRVIPGFMVQGGDPDGDGTGGPDHSVEGEFSSNGFQNDLKHERGVLSMARSQDPNSAGSQFFIVLEDSSHLDGDYAGFGKVIEGMDVVDEIASVETGSQDEPVEGQEQIIQSITVE
nr:peptidylprolyl isomerase [Alkalicoccobacillus murimartini]